MGRVAEASRESRAFPAKPGGIPDDIAHDLLGILTVIRGYVELLAGESSATVQAEYSGRILRACGKMARFVDDARDGELVLHKTPVHLAPFLHDCLAAHAAKARNKDIRLRIEVDVTPTIYFDPACVERVLDNLLDNAIKFSPRGTTISLTARVFPGQLEIDVHDDGQGVPPEEFQVIFEAFKTGRPRPTDGECSTGLGLAIVKKLVHAHQGEISLHSEVGLGSTFSIHLPLDTPTLSA